MGSYSRRDLLKAAGTLGAGWNFLPSLALAGGSSPQRIVFLYSMNGAVYDTWKMRPGGNPEGASWIEGLSGISEADWASSLTPLHGIRNQLNIIDGLAMVTAMTDQTFDPHALGQNHSLTGANIFPTASMTAVATAPSVDQIIADAVRTAAQWPSVQFTTGGLTEAGCIYGLHNEPLHLDNDPLEAWNRIFTQGLDPALFGPYAEQIAPYQTDVLELVAARYEQLQTRMSVRDQQKLEIHLDLIRDTQVRLANPIKCDPGPNPPSLNDLQSSGSPGQLWEASYDAAMNLTALALSCDLTRVASIQMTSLPGEMLGYPGINLHQEFAHDLEFQEQGRQVYTDYTRLHAQHVRNFIDLLDSIPDGGGSLLDSTAVVWVNELGDGAHNFGPWPVIMAGSCGGAIETGRYLYYARETPIAAEWPWAIEPTRVGPPHNQFLVSLCQMMGLSTQTIGRTQAVDDAGETIDLTGPLPGLI